MSKLKIAVAHHKVLEGGDPVLQNPAFINIGVGKELANTKDAWCRKNIVMAEGPLVELNYTMSELTHLHHLWKHQEELLDADTEYIGLCHYRRRFDPEKIGKLIEEQNPDIVCSLPAGIGIYRIQTQYWVAHDKEDFEDLLGYIKECFWHGQRPDITEAWLNMRMLPAPYNCVIMRKELFNDWCERLFAVLLDIYSKRKDDIDKRDTYQKRAIGFLGERFTSWYVTQMAIGQNKNVLQVGMDKSEGAI